jgi:hypothetical protein
MHQRYEKFFWGVKQNETEVMDFILKTEITTLSLSKQKQHHEHVFHQAC